jgi:ribosomal protein L39E
VDERAMEVTTEPRDRIPEPRRGERGDWLAQLDRRVARLERLLTGIRDGDEGAPELGILDPELVELALAAEYAQTLSQTLATPAVRAACEQAVQAWQEWQRRYEMAQQIAVTASRTIAITAPNQDCHLDGVRAFEAARAELTALRSCRRQYFNTAQHAQAQLDHDHEVREQHQAEIAAGHRAWTTLTTRLRMRIASAVEQAEPLPAWLVLSLSPPPAGGSTRWLELACQLLAYRITYSISDLAEPLGAEPTVDDSPRRRHWHRELAHQLASWQQASG